MADNRFSLDAYLDAWNAMDLEGIVAHYSEDARVTRSSVMRPWEGREEIRAGIGNYLSAWDDLRVTARNVLGNGERLAAILTYRGVHAHDAELAPGERIRPTGLRVAHDIAHFLVLDHEGLIERDEGVLDMLSFLGQVGASPEAIARASLRETEEGQAVGRAQ